MSESAGYARFGFIGLGNMGAPMALNITETMPTMVWDLYPESLKECTAAGAIVPTSVEEMIERCDMIAVCVAHEHEVRQLFLGDSGIVTRGRTGQVGIIHSTVPPSLVREIARAAEAKGIGIIDAPVSGGAAQGRSGNITMMIGAADWAFERAVPALRAAARNIVRVGEPGKAQVAKLANNMMTLCNLVVAMEAMNFANAQGVSRDALLAIAQASTGESWVVSNYSFHDLDGTWANGRTKMYSGPDEMAHRLAKDLRHAIATAQDELLALPIAALCAQMLPGYLSARWERQPPAEIPVWRDAE